MAKQNVNLPTTSTSTALDVKTKVGLGVGLIIGLGLLGFFANSAMRAIFILSATPPNFLITVNPAGILPNGCSIIQTNGQSCQLEQNQLYTPISLSSFTIGVKPFSYAWYFVQPSNNQIVLISTSSMYQIPEISLSGNGMWPGPRKLSLTVTDNYGQKTTKAFTLVVPCSTYCKVGDLNCDGQINATDAGMLTLANANPSLYSCADVNNDGKYDAIDVQTLINAITLGKNLGFWPVGGMACTDSDLDSNTGQSDSFMMGATTGLLNGVVTTTFDVCFNANQLTEYSCNNGAILGTNIWCNCLNGACVIPPQTTLNVGDIIKKSSASAVYYFGKDSKKHLFPNKSIFISWGMNLVPVKTISDAQFNAISQGANMLVRPVSYIIKFETSQNYYLAMPNGQVKQFASEAAVARLFGPYGNDWKLRIVQVPAAFEANYTRLAGSITIDDKYPNGSLVRDPNATNYYVQDGKLRKLVGRTILNINNIHIGLPAWAISPASYDYPKGLDITAAEDMFTRPY